MFRSKRSDLTKRLWKLRISTETSRTENDEARSAFETNSSNHFNDDMEVKSVTQAMLKRLKEVQLDCLLRAVDSQGADLSECVHVPKGDVRLGRFGTVSSPHVLFCQLWRWPELDYDSELKQIPCCNLIDDHLYICCNPYHWSQVHNPDTPPPPYSRFPPTESFISDNLSNSAISDASTETDGTFQYGSITSYHLDVHDALQCKSVSMNHDQCSYPRCPHWCNIAYWEERNRVGRLYPVYQNYMCVFGDVPLGDGLCLASLNECRRSSDKSVRRTREKIGLGVIISKDCCGVWLYNRSNIPVFVNSPTMDLPNTRTLSVHKILPGYSVLIFDFEKSKRYREIQDLEFLDGPFDQNAVRISFAKGWGPNYSRQFVTSCPCWLEILLMRR